MAVGKNKRLTKGKKGGKKKVGDPFLKKEWYDVKAPTPFLVRSVGKTLVTKSQGKKLASDGLRGRVCEINLADLMGGDEDHAHRKIRLSIEDIQGRNCLTDFHGMELTRDKLCSVIKKWHTLIEGWTDVRTTDGYTVRMFAIAFTKKQDNAVSSNVYAQASQVRLIRKRMVDVMNAEAGKVALRDLVKNLIAESIGKEIEKRGKKIYPLQNVFVRKVKILKKPKFDITRLMELHGDSGRDEGMAMERPETEAAQNTLTAEIGAMDE